MAIRAPQLERLRSPDTDVTEIIRMVEHNPPLARRIIKLANSAFFAGRCPARSVREAVVRLGTSTVADALFDAAA